MVYTCTKCNKTFNKKLNYERHIHKKVPCDKLELFTCENCGKEFNKIFNYERHKKRKTPCSRNVIENNTLPESLVQLEIEKEKTKREIEIEQEKTKQEEEKTKREIEKLKLKKDIIETQSQLKQKEIELRRLKNLDIETAKDKRKEKTATIINNNFTQNINIEATNFINNNFDAKIVCNSDGFKNKEVPHLFDHLNNTKKLERVCNDNKSLTDLLANIIKIAYNNDNNPETRYFIYDKNSEKFFVADERSKEYKIVNYEDIDKFIKHTTNKSYSKIEEVISKNSLSRDKCQEFKLYENIYIHNNSHLKSPAKIGLDPDNRIEKSENGYIRKKETNKYDGYFSDSSDEDEYD